MRLFGDDDNEVEDGSKNQDEKQRVTEEDLSKSPRKQIIWELMQSEEGRGFLSEDTAKNCYKELTSRLDVKLTPEQIKFIKLDILQKCKRAIESTPDCFLLDIPDCRRLLEAQITTRLGLLIEELEFKYKILFFDK